MYLRYSFPIIIRLDACFTLPGVGSTYRTVLMRCGRLVELSFFFIFIYVAVCVSQLQSFFLWKGEYFCLAVCLVIELCGFYILTESISVMLESKVLPAISDIHNLFGVCDSYCHLFTQFGINWFHLLFCLA